MPENMSQSINNSQKKPNYLLLGGRGFIGRELLKVLLGHNAKITCMIHKKPLVDENISFTKKIHFIAGSITNYKWESLQTNPPDIIFHLARIAGTRSLGRTYSANRSYKASKKLINWIQKSDPNIKLVYVSGSLSYGSREEGTTEDTPLNPVSYSKQYLKGELPIYHALKQNKDLPILICKPGWVYGKGSWFENFFLKPMRSNKIVPLYGDGNNWMSFIHVDDCAAMVSWIATQKVRGIYNLFIGNPMKQKELVGILSELSGFPIKKLSNLYIRSRYGKAVKEAFNFSLKIETNHKAFYQNYKPRYPNLRQGILEILNQNNLISF